MPKAFTDTTETEPAAITHAEFEIESNTVFRFSHDNSLFTAEELIRSMKMRFVTEDGEASAWQTITDLSCVDLKQQTPASVYGGQTAGYCNTPITGTITVTLPDGSGYSTDLPFGDVYIALKGDVDFSGETNASDAAKVLIYAADVGAGQAPDLYSSDKNDETLEQLTRCLADVNEDGLINASDAALILIYAAEQGAGKQPDWDAILKRTNGKS